MSNVTDLDYFFSCVISTVALAFKHTVYLPFYILLEELEIELLELLSLWYKPHKSINLMPVERIIRLQ